MDNTWDKNEFTVVKDDWNEDVEDEWDASEEEEEAVVIPAAAPAKPKPAVPAAKKKTEVATKQPEELPIETALERKLRMQRLQEASDLDNALHLFGSEHISVDNQAEGFPVKTVAATSVDWLQSLNPQTQKDFDAITETISTKFKSFEKNKLYVPFIDGLVKSLMADRELPEIRKVASSLTDLAALKQKEKLVKKAAPPSLGGAKKGASKGVYADFGDFDDDGDGFD